VSLQARDDEGGPPSGSKQQRDDAEQALGGSDGLIAGGEAGLPLRLYGGSHAAGPSTAIKEGPRIKEEAHGCAEGWAWGGGRTGA
jgi:hypothetical protein